MKKLVVGHLAERTLKSGIQLLDGKCYPNLSFDNEVVALYSEKGHLLGSAYLSKQNKGVGWFINKNKVDLNQAYFEELFRRAKEKRKSYSHSDLTTAYRVFNQDGDDFGGMSIDLYNDYALFSWYNPYVYQLRETICKAFQNIFPEVSGAYEKIRFKGLDYESAHLFGQESPQTFTVLENGVAYSVFLNDGLMTGIFLDQHDVRASLVDGLAQSQSVLNMFSYTAAFSVAAAMGGATKTTSVDLAKRSRELSEAHFLANGLSTNQHQFVVMDVFEYFKYAKRKGLCFDMIVIDPPSFARNKKQTFSVVRDYHKLITQAVEILSPKGTIIASTNASNMTVEQFKKQLDKGFGQTKHRYHSLNQLPADFTYNKNDESSNYLKVFTIKVDI